MRAASILIFIVGTQVCLGQVIIHHVDASGKRSVDTIKTNRPDTIKDPRTEFVKKAISTTQGDQPIFRSRQDSVAYISLQAEIQMELSKQVKNGSRLDSLMRKNREIINKGIVGFRRVYRPDPNYFSYDSISQQTHLENITHLSLAGIKAKRLPPQIKRCYNLEKLELVNTSIEKLDRSLKKLKKLRQVSVFNNKLAHPLKLSRNQYITTLLIRSEQPVNLPTHYKKIKNLNLLDLSDCYLTVFPNGGRKNKKLEELKLRYNAITLDENNIKPHPYLKKIDFFRNQITTVPPSIANLRALNTLKFSHNKINTVAPEISKLQQLEQLSFYNNKLTAIPPVLFDLPSLKEIDLYYNEISRLEDAAVNWKKLEVLYLAFNKVFFLTEKLGEMTALQELYLHDNRLSYLPESIGKLKNLKVLRINNNSLPELPLALLQLNELENLDISRNSIQTISPDFFSFQHLKIIALVANPWDAKTREMLPLKARELRDKKIIVHLNSFEESIDE